MPTSKRDGVYTRSDRKGYWISFVDAQGRRRQRKTKAHSLAQARSILSAELLKVDQARTLGYAPPGNETFAELAQRYLRHQKVRIGPPHFLRLESIIEKHLAPHFTSSLAHIKRADVNRFVTIRSEQVAPATVAKELATLHHMLSLAVEWEFIPLNPAASVRPPKQPPGRVRYLQPAELRQLIQMAADWLRPIIAIAVLTGMRRSEILGLRWADIDLRARRLILRRTKNNSVRTGVSQHLCARRL
jgi:integrase